MKSRELIRKTARSVLETVDIEMLNEMANLISDFTGLSHNIVLWTKPQPEELPHSKYRLKVYKNRAHVATYLIGANPKLVFTVKKRSYYELDSSERVEIEEFIRQNYGVLISFIDEKISEDDLKEYLGKILGSK